MTNIHYNSGKKIRLSDRKRMLELLTDGQAYDKVRLLYVICGIIAVVSVLLFQTFTIFVIVAIVIGFGIILKRVTPNLYKKKLLSGNFGYYKGCITGKRSKDASHISWRNIHYLIVDDEAKCNCFSRLIFDNAECGDEVYVICLNPSTPYARIAIPTKLI